MIDLRPLFENFFNDERHSLLELARYGNKHLIYLSANNPGNVLDDVIAEVSGANTAFVGCVGDEEALAAARKAANEARNNLKRGMSGPTGVVSKASAAVQAAFGRPSPDYTACFPLGVEGITGASIAQMEERLENLRAALAARSAQVGAAHVTAITNLKAAWVSLKTAADTASGAENTGEEHRAACREALCRALTRSVLWLAWHFNGQPEKHDVYCPVHLLKNAQPQLPGTCSIEVTGGVEQVDAVAHASGATVARWYRRLAGAPDWTELGTSALDEPVTFDGLAPGTHEFKARGENDEGPGPESDVVSVEVTG